MPRSSTQDGGSYYAVRVGRKAGIYRTWDECKAEVNAYPGAIFKKFKDLNEAQTFAGPQAPLSSATSEHTSAPGRVNTPMARTHRAAPYISERSTGDGQRKPREVGRKLTRVNESVTHPTAPPPLVGETEDKIVVYTDGASSKNGKKGARAGVGVYFGALDPRNISESLAGPRQTNQRAELMAVLRAIETVSSSGSTKTLVICTDSMYTINCVSVWHYKWESCGWVNSAGQQVNNQDLIRAILLSMKEYRGSIQFIHVRGHSGIHGNEQADLLAVQGANTVMYI
ncbi:Ribonuclease H1 [Coemansia sp. S142-1]|nr:Ribonuclease H1 [Coemansia sp. S17]KAJ2110605.1 Ribonuclease H1 [Coemansia sp. S142-1]